MTRFYVDPDRQDAPYRLPPSEIFRVPTDYVLWAESTARAGLTGTAHQEWASHRIKAAP